MSGRSHIAVLLLALALAAPACGADGGGDPVDSADAAPVSEFACQSSSGGAGGDVSADLSLGLQNDGSYLDLADGDDASLAIGYQGLFMLLLESHASLTFDTDRVCLVCDTEVSPSETGFLGTGQNGPVDFVAMAEGGDQFAGTFTVVLGPTSEIETYSGAEVEVTMVCEGHGFTGVVERSVRLMTE